MYLLYVIQQTFEWNKLRKKEIKAPYLPKIANDEDTTNCPEYSNTMEDVMEEEVNFSGPEYEWTKDF